MIKHAFASAKSDGADATLVQPSNWNAEHPVAIPGGLFAGVSGDTGWELLPSMQGPNQWGLWRSVPGGPLSLGVGVTVVGTLGSPSYATTSLATRQQTNTYLSAATANNGTGLHQSVGSFIVRSTTAGRGGFFFHARVVLGANMGAANGRLFVGMHSSNAALTQDPSAMTGDFIGFAYDAADTHLRLMSRDNVTTNNIDLGATAPKTDGLMYDLYLYCPPGGAQVYYRVDLANGNTFTARLLEGNVATNLPRTDIPLSYRVQGGTSTTTQVTLGIAQFGVMWQSN